MINSNFEPLRTRVLVVDDELMTPPRGARRACW
jgi:hypothetical protein